MPHWSSVQKRGFSYGVSAIVDEYGISRDTPDRSMRSVCWGAVAW